METGFLFRISAFAAESITFCITAAMCIITGYIDGSCGTFAVLIVGTVVCFAVDVNGLMGFYMEAYLRIYKMSGISFVERYLIGFEDEMTSHCIEIGRAHV